MARVGTTVPIPVAPPAVPQRVAQPLLGRYSLPRVVTLSGRGWLAIGLGYTAGIGLTAVAFQLSREQRGYALPLFFAGLLVAVLPSVAAIAYATLTRSESALLLLGVAITLYLVKVLHSPSHFTFADELAHVWNADRILDTGRLAHGNPSLPITTRFPGLEVLTAGLASAAGISTFAAGLIVVGVARCVLMLGLFCLFDVVSGSRRVGALASAFFLLDPNFLYWSAQFSYQSLAFPLAIVALLAVFARPRSREPQERRTARAWTAVGVISILAIVPTHHMTSYVLALLLALIAAVAHFVERRAWRAPWDLALVAAAAAVCWLLLRARLAFSYLSDIFSAAYDSFARILNGAALPRKPFEATLYHVPVGVRAVAVAGLLVVTGAVAFATFRRARRYFGDPFRSLFWLACLGYLGTYVLRFVPSAWEIANRASEFLLLGTSLVLALSGIHAVLLLRFRLAGAIAFTLLFGVCFSSSVINGWPTPALLALPQHVKVGDTAIEPQGFAAASWARASLGTGQRMITDETNGKLMMTIGGELPSMGLDGYSRSVLNEYALDAWQVARLRASGARYVLVDRRTAANDAILGYYFGRASRPAPRIPAYERTKFARAPWADRIFDSGDIVIYSVDRLRHGPGS